jgi:hypothetical protein
MSKQEAAACHRLLHSALSGNHLNDLRDSFHVYFERALEQCPGGDVDFFSVTEEMIFCCIS